MNKLVDFIIMQCNEFKNDETKRQMHLKFSFEFNEDREINEEKLGFPRFDEILMNSRLSRYRIKRHKYQVWCYCYYLL